MSGINICEHTEPKSRSIFDTCLCEMLSLIVARRRFLLFVAAMVAAGILSGYLVSVLHSHRHRLSWITDRGMFYPGHKILKDSQNGDSIPGTVDGYQSEASIQQTPKNTDHRESPTVKRPSTAKANSRSPDAPKLILLWTGLYTDPHWEVTGPLEEFFHRWGCPVSNCVLTSDRETISKADAVLISNLLSKGKVVGLSDPPPRAHGRQVFGLAWYESPHYTPNNSLEPFDSMFNLTITYSERSDIMAPYGVVSPKDKPLTSGTFRLTAQQLQKKTRPVAWLISHCGKNKSPRNEYVEELNKHIAVDVYGDCGEPCPPKNSSHRNCFIYMEEKYKFYLAFENSFCEEYVTEKLFRTLGLNLVPVIMGAADYAKILPEKSAVNVFDFTSPRHLAKHLQSVAEDDDAYQEYFAWKGNYDVRQRHHVRMDAFCRLCEILHDPTYTYRQNFAVSDWWSTKQCTMGPNLVQKLGLHNS